MLLDELANELVTGTSALVGGRTINIMDTDGIIIASTEPVRIGSFHQGAKEAAQTGKVVNIYHDQLARYPGAKEGCNMPLRLGGSIIGVVGIYGDPDKIQDVAHLLQVYATKYYQLEAMLRPRMTESVMRLQLLLDLLTPSGGSVGADAHNLLNKLNLTFRFPVNTVVISTKSGAKIPQSAERLHQLLDELGFQRKGCDLWGIVEDRMVLLCSQCADRSIRSLRALNGEGYRICLGCLSGDLNGIRTAYDQAALLDRTAPGVFNDIQDAGIRCGYLLSQTALQERELLEKMYRSLRDTYGEGNTQVMLDSIETYYNCGHSVSAAATQQFIHKNTLQYRVKRVLEALDLASLPVFSQEYLIRLLLEHIHRKSGSQDLEK